jgi:micrococcal nuclease
MRRIASPLLAALLLVACTQETPLADVSPRASRPGTPTATAHGRPAFVMRVIDGDTVEVRYRGRNLDVRLIGIDTPETVAPGQPVECGGLAASRFTERHLDGERVGLEFDAERLDQYGRTLAYVWLGDRLFNRTLVAKGYAQVSTFPPNVKYVEVFLAAQRRAREANVGMWRTCTRARSLVGVTSGSSKCDPSSPTVCIPPPPPDLDCSDVRFTNFKALPPDPQHFDGDHNGIGCEIWRPFRVGLR